MPAAFRLCKRHPFLILNFQFSLFPAEPGGFEGDETTPLGARAARPPTACLAKALAAAEA